MTEPTCGHRLCRRAIYTNAGHRRRYLHGCRYETRTARGIAQVLSGLGVLAMGKRVCIERIVAGHWQRSAGSWVWAAHDEDGREIRGSSWPASVVIGAHRRGWVIDKGSDFGLEVCPGRAEREGRDG